MVWESILELHFIHIIFPTVNFLIRARNIDGVSSV